LINLNPIARGISLLFITGFLILCAWACEKDDICVDGDTPLLVVRFYDANDTSQLKTVTKLRVTGLGQTSQVDTFKDRTTLDSISLPLRTDTDETSFILIFDSASKDGAETGNPDTLRFTYNTSNVFVSRACGFVTNYDNLATTPPSDSQPWIQSISIVNPSVQSQTAAHVKIYH
jgi:hypothetical protein